MRIVFIGTPDFSVPSLEALINSEFDVVGVITAPDRRAGRGMKLKESPIKKTALKHNIPVLQPTNLKNQDFQKELAALRADIQIVIAFRMLPEAVWDMPPMGTINLHASLLPVYRGAAPINWAIMNGEQKTGLTTFKLKHAIDTGNLLLQHEMDIFPEDDAGSLHDRMSMEGADLILATVRGLHEGNLTEKEQEFTPNLPKAPKIFKADCLLNWEEKAEDVHNKIRGLSPYPGAYTHLQDKSLKIFKSDFEAMNHSFLPGSYDTDTKEHLSFYTADGVVRALDVQMEGKKRMSISQFLAGYKWR
jgi:methionyl-tRNA formyltransferase